MKIRKNPMFLYLVIQVILFQLLGVIGLNKYNKPELKHFFIYMDIAVCLSLIFHFIVRVLKRESKLLSFIILPCIIFFAICSICSIYRLVY